MSRQATLLLAVLSGALAACSGGNGGSSVGVPGCGQVGSSQGQGEAMCLISCNLGCTQAGCAINQIAQNQPVILVFNQDVDPATVNSSSISFRTASGEEPVGQYLVNGNVVTFLPQVRISGAQAFFGFKSSAVYTMTLPGGANQINAIKSTSSSRLGSRYTCNLAVTKGVEDLDGQPPTAKLVSPSNPNTPVSPTTPLTVEFSELISAAPFLGSTSQTAPIKVNVVRQDASGNCGTGTGVPVSGTWDLYNDPVLQVTQATFNPLQPMPSTACVQVNVTNLIQDLSGKPAVPQFFQYKTIPVASAPVAVEEPFDSGINLDVEYSSGSWGNGAATPGLIGNDGLHGDFDIALGTQVSMGVYEWDTDDTLIPRTNTLSGQDEHVTDGVYRFSRFVLPNNFVLRFVGSHPARIYVRGLCSIGGTIDVSGITPPAPAATAMVGQAGGDAGAGGGAGGRGGDAGDGTGNKPNFNGQDGEDVQLPANVSYTTQPAGTGGAGSVQFPLSGLTKDIVFTYFGSLSLQISAGGGGGGFAVPGQVGQGLQAYQGMTSILLGPPAAGGSSFPLYPLPMGVSAIDYLMVGGSGGGGGGSNTYRTSSSTKIWHAGGGGGGGGGALGLRVGGDLTMEAGSTIDAAGGDSLADPDPSAVAAMGGAGSGGSVLMQAAGAVSMKGVVDVSGGDGAEDLDSSVFNTKIEGGDGGHGYIRLETTASPSASLLGTTVPDMASSSGAVRVAAMSEKDTVVGSQSLWYTLKLVFPPQFLRYEIEATVGGQAMTFSDDPAKGIVPTATSPVQLVVQGAELDSQNQINLTEVTNWTHYVGPFAPPGEVSLSQSGKAVRAFRFVLLFNRSTASTVTVDKVTIWYQP